MLKIIKNNMKSIQPSLILPPNFEPSVALKARITPLGVIMYSLYLVFVIFFGFMAIYIIITAFGSIGTPMIFRVLSLVVGIPLLYNLLLPFRRLTLSYTLTGNTLVTWTFLHKRTLLLDDLAAVDLAPLIFLGWYTGWQGKQNDVIFHVIRLKTTHNRSSFLNLGLFHKATGDALRVALQPVVVEKVGIKRDLRAIKLFKGTI